MATYVKGNPVENATSYELFEKVGSAYKSLKTGSEINFDVSALGLSGGNHTLVVKAKADGYEDSDYSNEVVYAVEGGSFIVPLETLPKTGYYMSSGNGKWNSYNTTNRQYDTKMYDISAYRGKTITVTRAEGQTLRFAMIVDDANATPSGEGEFAPTFAGGGTLETAFIRYGTGENDMSNDTTYTTTIPNDATFMVINCHANGTDFNHTVVIS